MITDFIANYLTRIRNALKAQHGTLAVKSSKTIEAITKVLCEQGYVKSYVVEPNPNCPQPTMKVELKYGKNRQPALYKIKKVSTPSLRRYISAKELQHRHVLNGLGIAIISTSQGIMTDKEARKRYLGGEILCDVS